MPKKIILVTKDLLLSFWAYSLSRSVISHDINIFDLHNLKFAIRLFLRLRDIGISTVPLAVLFDIIMLLHEPQNFTQRIRENQEKISNHKDNKIKTEYKNKCLLQLLTPKCYQKIRNIFQDEEFSESKLMLFCLQLFETVNEFVQVKTTIHESGMHQQSNFLVKLITKEKYLDPKSERSVQAISRTIDEQFSQIVKFLKYRLNKNEQIPTKDNLKSIDHFFAGDDEISELKFANILTKRSLLMQFRAIKKIAQEIKQINHRQLPDIFMTENLAEHKNSTFYPTGGIEEFSKKGNPELLLPTELMLMNENVKIRDKAFNLFNLKFMDNELLYFQRNNGNNFRKFYKIQVVIVNYEFFNLKLSNHEHNFETYFYTFLYKTIKELYRILDRQGVNIDVLWVSEDNSLFLNTTGSELFDCLFYEEIRDNVFTSKIVCKSQMEKIYASPNSNDFSWYFLIPPGESAMEIEIPTNELVEKIEDKMHFIQFSDNEFNDYENSTKVDDLRFINVSLCKNCSTAKNIVQFLDFNYVDNSCKDDVLLRLQQHQQYLTELILSN